MPVEVLGARYGGVSGYWEGRGVWYDDTRWTDDVALGMRDDTVDCPTFIQWPAACRWEVVGPISDTRATSTAGLIGSGERCLRQRLRP